MMYAYEARVKCQKWLSPHWVADLEKQIENGIETACSNSKYSYSFPLTQNQYEVFKENILWKLKSFGYVVNAVSVGLVMVTISWGE